MRKIFPKRIIAVISAACTILTCGLAFPITGHSESYEYYYGDLNGDDEVNTADLKLLGSFLSGKKTKAINLWAGDMNDDDKVNVTDYIYLKRLIVHGIYPGEAVPPEADDEDDPTKKNMQEVLELVNEDRSKVGAAPLELNEEMCGAAMIRAKEIAEYFSHTRPDGRDCFSVLEENGIRYSYVGENIAAGNSSAEGTMDQWVHSAGHYKNIINTDFTELGVGYVYIPNTKYRYYWVQLFRQP